MFVVFANGGKQYKVSEGDELVLERMDGEVGDKLELGPVLACFDGDSARFAADVETMKVEGEVLAQGRGKKILVFKYKSKKGYRRMKGHRQPFTRVRITRIG